MNDYTEVSTEWDFFLMNSDFSDELIQKFQSYRVKKNEDPKQYQIKSVSKDSYGKYTITLLEIDEFFTVGGSKPPDGTFRVVYSPDIYKIYKPTVDGMLNTFAHLLMKPKPINGGKFRKSRKNTFIKKRKNKSKKNNNKKK
jgi:hypothetical protein